MTAAENRKRNKDAGFSLLELLIAVVILAIIVIPLLNVFLSSNRLNIKSRETLRATTAAQDIMEGLKAYDIKELKAQFADPASGFYVIDSRLVKGGLKEEEALEKDPSGKLIPGLYVFSMEEVSLQGSRFDAKIVVDGREYRTDTSTASPDTHDKKFNDAALADARSIDKKNGTFAETETIRAAVLHSVFKDSSMQSAIEAKLLASGVPPTNLANEYLNTQDATHFKNLSSLFSKVAREITITLEDHPTEEDKNGKKLVNMTITQKYTFEAANPALGTTASLDTWGYMGSGVWVENMPCGKITRMTDAAGKEKINVNLFYYPLYGYGSGSDKIIICNKTGADISLLIAKQRHEKEDPVTGLPDLTDPEYYTDPQLMAAERNYRVDVEIREGDALSGPWIANDHFSIKTNLGLNLVGEKYLAGAGTNPDGTPKEPLYVQAQFTVNGTNMDLSGSSHMNLYTLDGVRSPMGNPATPGESTELIYDVEVSLYEEGAAAEGFPDDKRIVVIGGSTTN